MWKKLTISDEVYKFYIEDTKRGKNSTKECVERKLLAMSLVAPIVYDNGVGCKRYQFGTFNFLVRQKDSRDREEPENYEVGMVYWVQKPCYVPEEKSKMLHELYQVIGLSEDGQTVLGPLDEGVLTNYCIEHNLTNMGSYRNFMAELFANVL